MKFGIIAKIISAVAAVAIVTATAATATVYAVSNSAEANTNVTAASTEQATPAEPTAASTKLVSEKEPSEAEETTENEPAEAEEAKKDIVENITIYILGSDISDTHKSTVIKNLKQYEAYGIAYDSAKLTLSYDGKPVCYLEDVIKDEKTDIYTFNNSDKNALYLSIARGEKNEITGVKVISKEETISEVSTTRNITILGVPKFGDFDIKGFDLGFESGFRSKNITDFSDYESLGFSYDKEKEVLTFNGEVVSSFIDSTDKDEIKLYTDYTDGIGKSVIIIDKDGKKAVFDGDDNRLSECFEGLDYFIGVGDEKIWAMKDNDEKLVGYEIVVPDMTEYVTAGLVVDTEKGTITFNGKNVASVDDESNGLLIFARGSTINGAVGVDVIRDKDGKISKIVENDHCNINISRTMTDEELAELKKNFKEWDADIKEWASEIKAWGDSIADKYNDYECDWDEWDGFEGWSDSCTWDDFSWAFDDED